MNPTTAPQMHRVTALINEIHHRLDRAYKLITELKDKIRMFVESQPLVILSRTPITVSGIRCEQVYVELTEDIPLDFGMASSEAIHHMRAILDNLIWAIGTSNGSSTSISFPIVTSADQYPLNPGFKAISKSAKKQKSDLGKLPLPVQAVVEQVQPYNQSGNAGNSPLWLLNRLSNHDKHRAPTFSVSNIRYRYVPSIDDGSRVRHGGGRVATLISSGDTATINIPIFHSVVQYVIEPEIVIEQIEPLGIFPAPFILDGLHRFVNEDVVHKIAPP